MRSPECDVAGCTLAASATCDGDSLCGDHAIEFYVDDLDDELVERATAAVADGGLDG